MHPEVLQLEQIRFMEIRICPPRKLHGRLAVSSNLPPSVLPASS
jgi:hypothetical protein